MDGKIFRRYLAVYGGLFAIEVANKPSSSLKAAFSGLFRIHQAMYYASIKFTLTVRG